jgi:hypothetical protein
VSNTTDISAAPATISDLPSWGDCGRERCGVVVVVPPQKRFD